MSKTLQEKFEAIAKNDMKIMDCAASELLGKHDLTLEEATNGYIRKKGYDLIRGSQSTDNGIEVVYVLMKTVGEEKILINHTPEEKKIIEDFKNSLENK